MGFIDDMKKLLWAKKAVAKSAAKKGAKEIQDISAEGYDRVKDFTDDVAHKAEEAFDKARDYVASKTDSSWDKPDEEFVPSGGTDSETVAPISETMKRAAKAGSEKLKQAKKAGSEAFEQVKKTSGEALDKAVDMSDKVWDKIDDANIPEKAQNLVDKVTDKVNTTMDEMLKKAEALDKTIEDEKRAMDSDGDGYADIPTHQKLRDQGSLLDDKDDFWSKAESYADGDYSMGKARVVGTDDSVEKPDDGSLKGFEDRDGDGDPLMDDAIIVDDSGDETVGDDEDDTLKLLPLRDDESE